MNHLVQAIDSGAGTAAVLSVSPNPEDHLALERIFTDHAADSCAPWTWQMSHAATLPAAWNTLEQSRQSILVCERNLPGGGWTGLLEHSARLPDPPLMIVTSRHADEYLWAEALNLGAYDVLAKPFYPLEVIRVLSLAYLRWRRGSSRLRAGSGQD